MRDIYDYMQQGSDAVAPLFEAMRQRKATEIANNLMERNDPNAFLEATSPDVQQGIARNLQLRAAMDARATNAIHNELLRAQTNLYGAKADNEASGGGMTPAQQAANERHNQSMQIAAEREKRLKEAEAYKRQHDLMQLHQKAVSEFNRAKDDPEAGMSQKLNLLSSVKDLEDQAATNGYQVAPFEPEYEDPAVKGDLQKSQEDLAAARAQIAAGNARPGIDALGGFGFGFGDTGGKTYQQQADEQAARIAELSPKLRLKYSSALNRQPVATVPQAQPAPSAPVAAASAPVGNGQAAAISRALSAIANGKPEAAVRARFKQIHGFELP